MSDKMREEFEGAIIAEFNSVGIEGGPDLCRNKNNGDYLNQVVGGAWWAWQASRESLSPTFTAVDMATAAADGFRDGVASKSEPCDGCFMAEAEALRKDAERYQHIKSTWHDGGLIDHLAANVLPEDWDVAIDADMGNGD